MKQANVLHKTRNDIIGVNKFGEQHSQRYQMGTVLIFLNFVLYSSPCLSYAVSRRNLRSDTDGDSKKHAIHYTV